MAKKEVLHQVTIGEFRLEFRAPLPGRSTGSIACFRGDGIKAIEIPTPLDTIDDIIQGIAAVRTRMRDLTVTMDLGPPEKP